MDVREYRVYRRNPASNAFELENTLPAGARSYAPTQPGEHVGSATGAVLLEAYVLL